MSENPLRGQAKEASREDAVRETFVSLLNVLRSMLAYMSPDDMEPVLKASHPVITRFLAELGTCNHEADYCICEFMEFHADLTALVKVADTPMIVLNDAPAE